ncbi:MAG TPA: hypothetical protein VN033_15890 [Vulgatibacter sp.]|nr:hypothetical protein [Vulgatibacter sp.]
MIQVVGYLALGAAIAIAAIAAFVWARARQAVPDGNAPVYRVRKYYAAALVVAMVGAFAWSLPLTPYDALASGPAVRVDVVGTMWSWKLKKDGDDSAGPLVLPVGTPIDFDVTSTDVTHAFGVYDEDGQLLGQTQAMPGYTNRLRLVFDEPGRFHVLCLEFCGVVHHLMLTEFTVR